MIAHVSTRDGEARHQGIIPFILPQISQYQYSFTDSHCPIGCCDRSAIRIRPGESHDAISGSIWEEVDIACESGCVIHHTFPTPHCLPDYQGRIWLDAEGVVGVKTSWR